MRTSNEIKKNVIFKLSRIDRLDDILIAAAAHLIYDLIKVDYVIDDIGKVNGQLFKAAMEVINQKKERYAMATNMRLNPVSQVYGEEYYSLYPDQLYHQYRINNSATVYHTYYGTYERHDLPQEHTIYYDKVGYSGIDRVINPAVTEPPVELGLRLQVKYRLQW